MSCHLDCFKNFKSHGLDFKVKAILEAGAFPHGVLLSKPKILTNLPSGFQCSSPSNLGSLYSFACTRHDA